MSDRLAMTEEQAEAAARFKSRERQELEDLAELSGNDGFCRFMRWHLSGLGIGRQIDECELARHNLGVMLIRRVGRVNPARAREILAHCYGLD